MQFLTGRVFRVMVCPVLLFCCGCGVSRLERAIQEGDVHMAKQLIADGTNVNVKGVGGETAFAGRRKV